MPWISIIAFLVSFLLSKSQGASLGKAAAIGAAAGFATYYVADPSNPDNLLGIGAPAKDNPGSVLTDNGGAAPSTGGGRTVGGVISTGLSEVGSVLKSWGPAGSLAVVAGTKAVTSPSTTKWLPWVIGGAALFFLLK